MKRLRTFFVRLFALFGAHRNERSLSAEIDEHLKLLADDYLAQGLSPEEACRRAALKFGSVASVREDYRQQNGLPRLESFLQDARYTLRRLRKSPIFAVTTVLTLALGIGLTTSIFTLVHAVLLQSLAVAKPSELLRLGKQSHCCIWSGYNQGSEFSIVSYELYKYFRSNTKGFVELAAFQAGGGGHLLGVKRANSPEAARGYSSEFVSGNYFTMFGLNPAAGRLLVPADEDFAASPVAVISHRLWQQRYNSDPRVIGSVFNFNDKPVTIVGVTPSVFFGDTMSQAPPDFFLPLVIEPLIKGDSTLLQAPARSWLELIGRVQPGTNVQSLEAEMRVQLQQWLRSHWGEMDEDARVNLPKQTLYLSPGGAGITVMRERYERWLQILMMISGLVLLIVCANVASLMLVRAIARRQQVALSNALGASTSRLVRSALTESFLLALIGGAAGLVISVISTKLILRFAFASHIDGFGYVPISSSPSLPILLFAFAISLLTGIIFGVAPAWMAAKADPIEALRGASRSTGGTGSMPRRVLVVLQAALALVLLSVARLLTATLHNLENQDLGFEQDRRTVVNLDPNLAGYHADQLTNLYLRVRDAMMAIPGVESVASATYAPQSGDSWTDTMYIDGRSAPHPQDDNAAGFDRITPDYFEVVGNPIVEGRAFSELDNRQSHNVAIVNEAFARKFFRNEDPIGKYFGRMEIDASRLYEVVGVAKDSRILTYNPDRPVGPFFFIPQEQYDTFPTPELTQSDVRTHYAHDIIIKTKPGIKLAAADIQRAMESVDTRMPIISIVSMREQVANQYTQQRLIARLTSSLGLVALLLASIGMYGVTAYNSKQRVKEIGVRMALGANQANVIALILRGALLLITSGLVIGIPLTVAAGYVLGSQLFGMKPYSVGITALAVLTVGLSAFVAALVPAFRASRISPLEALRTE